MYLKAFPDSTTSDKDYYLKRGAGTSEEDRALRLGEGVSGSTGGIP
jgi:hypothetical protein